MTDKEKEHLIESARMVQKNSYAPYSNFHVGAAVQTESGDVFVGTNIENASYGLTICAERSAIFTAISHGHARIRAIAITTINEKPTPPCGACRQVMKEFSMPNTLVIMAGREKEIEVKTVDDLLPFSFSL
jgi:cytidine deaminase